MSRPLQRGVSGGTRLSGDNQVFQSDTQKKDKTNKEDLDQNRTYLSIRNPFQFLFPENPSYKQCITENGFTSTDPFIPGTTKNRFKFTLLLLKFSLVIIVILALTGSLLWTLSITNSPRGGQFHGYRRLQEQVVSDLEDIGKISLGSSRLKELEYCSPEFDNFVPCYNETENLAIGFSGGEEFNRHCLHGLNQNCLVLPPLNYKVPLRWPSGKDIIWFSNVNITGQELMSSGSLTKRMMRLDEEQVSFRPASLMYAGVEDYSHQIAAMIGLRNESNFIKAGVRTILDIGCGYGSFGAHLFSSELLTMCVAEYEASGSQVQLTLERGLPAMIGSLNWTQLPFPSLSYDMIHCRNNMDWDKKEGMLLIEVDRLLRPGGYFVWTSPFTQPSIRDKEKTKKWNFIRTFALDLCWVILSQQEETVVWKKTDKKDCYTNRKSSSVPLVCSKGRDVESPYYRPLQACIGGTQSRRWVPIGSRTTWPSMSKLNSKELSLHGLHLEDLAEDSLNWNSAINNYWSLLSPVVFSDHPKRPGDEDPSPPYNMLRNVLDMNSHYGGFNAALLEAGKSVWVMNVVPKTSPNHLPLIVDRGFVGVLHDWCEPFPSYPRTYDLIHAEGLLSLDFSQQRRCELLNLLTEIDRLLRPEGWVILRDTAPLIESARALATRLKWDARIVETESDSDEKLLICQKPHHKRQANY